MSAVAAAVESPFTVDYFERWAYELELDNGEPWRVDDFFLAFVEDLFSGFPVNWLVVPEGNGKTTDLAGLALHHCEFRDHAFAPWAASARSQAEIGYVQAEGFVLRSPRLSQLFVCQAGYRKIKNRMNGSKIQVFAADEGHADGVIPTLPIIDEAHRHKNLGLIRTWRGKLQKRGGQMVVISTAGEPGGEFEEMREKMRQAATDTLREECFVRAAGPGYVLHEWAVPEDGDVDDLELVARANPASFVTVDTLREKREDPIMTLAHWRRFSCSLPTRGDHAAITEAEWYAARASEAIPEGQAVGVGLDVAWKWDTTALVPLWIKDAEHRQFGPARVLEPPRDGNSLDARLIERALIELDELNPIEIVVMDTSKAEQLGQWIEETFQCPVVDRQQTNPLAALDYERFMEALREGWLKHAGDQGLTSHALNAVARLLPGGDTRFDRPHRSRLGSQQDQRVVDALTAAAMVHSTMVAMPAKKTIGFAFV